MKTTSKSILDDTVIVKAPWNIAEVPLNDTVNDKYKEKEEDIFNGTDRYSKGRSTTTRSGSPKQLGQANNKSKFQFTRHVSLVNWKEYIGLDETKDYDNDFVMNVVLEKMKDPSNGLNGVIVSTIF